MIKSTTHKTFKREMAVILFIFMISCHGIYFFVLDLDEKIAYLPGLNFISLLTVSFLAAAFGMDSYAKQVAGHK